MEESGVLEEVDVSSKNALLGDMDVLLRGEEFY